jgi:hypothetical protein
MDEEGPAKDLIAVVGRGEDATGEQALPDGDIEATIMMLLGIVRDLGRGARETARRHRNQRWPQL